MGKIKDGLKSLGGKLKKVPQNSQGKAFARILQFFAIMIVLTIFVKGASAVTMPKVKAAMPGQGEITNTLEAGGTVTALSNVDMKISAGLMVKRVLKAVGTEVKEGDKLIEFDVTAMKEYLLSQKIILNQMKIDLQNLLEATGPDDSAVKAAQKMVDTAFSEATKADNSVIDTQNAYNAAAIVGDGAITAAVEYEARLNDTTTLTAAAAAAATAKAAYDAAVAESPPNQVTIDLAKLEWDNLEGEYQKLLGDYARLLSSPNAFVREAEAGKSANLATAQEAVDGAKTVQSNMRVVYNDAVVALDKAKKEHAELQKDQALVNQKNKLAIEAKRAEILKQENLICDAEEAQTGDGILLSTVSGTILDINVQEGQVVPEGARVRVSTGDEGFVVEGKLSQTDARQLKVGALVTVMRTGYYWGEEAKVLGKTAPDQNGMITVTASLPGNYWTQGESVKLSLVLNSQMYGNTVSLSALHKDSDGDFVLVVKEENTILGTQMVARKAYVTIGEPKGKDIASIEFKDGGMYQSKVITSSSKQVKDGDWVRVEDE